MGEADGDKEQGKRGARRAQPPLGSERSGEYGGLDVRSSRLILGLWKLDRFRQSEEAGRTSEGGISTTETAGADRGLLTGLSCEHLELHLALGPRRLRLEQ